MTAPRVPPGSGPTLSVALRLATGGAGAAVVLSVLFSGVAPVTACLALLAVQLLTTAPLLRDALPPTVVKVAPWVVIGVGVAVAAGSGFGTPGGLAVLACSTVVGHHVLVATHRDVAVSLLTTTGTALLVVSQATSWTVVPALALAWTAGVAAVGLRLAERRPGSPTGLARAWAPVLRRLAWPVAASLVAVLVVGLLGVQPPSAGQRLANGAAGFDGQRAGRSTAAYLSGRLDMRVRGELPLTPVVEVPAASDRLWRAGVLASYDGVAWSPAVLGGSPRTGSDPLGFGDLDPSAPATGQPRSEEVRVLDDLGGLLLAPGHPVGVRSASGPVALEVYGQSAYGQGGRLSSAYTVDSLAVPDARDVGGVATGRLPEDPDDAAWTALPSTVTERTRALAREITRDARTRGEVVAAVEDHLRDTYGYDLGSPVPPAGQDAVDHFLFDARTGFCEQFAAAEVVLLRSLGVPARMATGFSGGQGDGDRRVVRADDAHAWAEVWQPGVGWSPSDPTPAAAASTGLLARVATVLADPAVRRSLAALLVLSFVAAAVVAVLRRRRRTRGAGPAEGSGGPPRTAAAERLLVALARSGRASPAGETVAAVAGRVPEVAGALAVVERAAYAGRPPGARESLEAQAALDAATGRLLAAESGRRPS